MFSLVYSVLIHPYPYRDADRLANPFYVTNSGGPYWFTLTGSQYRQFRGAHSLDDSIGWDDQKAIMTGEGVAEDLQVNYLTPNATNFFGVPPLIGRAIMPFDAPDGKPVQPVAVLAYKFWQRHFNGALDVLGRTIQLDHKRYTIVGVMPPRFTFGNCDLYAPLDLSSVDHQIMLYLKLKPGVSYAAANAEFQSLLEPFAKETPLYFPPHFRVQIGSLIDPVVKGVGPTLFSLFAAVVLLLLIGCVNCSILLLARGKMRQHELSVRAALGASRSRIVLQLLTESLILSLSGAVIGIALAYRLAKTILQWTPDAFPGESVIEINLPVLAFCVGLALFAGILFGLWPALQASRSDLAPAMQSRTRGATSGTGLKRIHNFLVAGQIALTLLLLAAAGAASADFLQLAHANLGYDPHGAMAVGIPLHESSLPSREARAAYFTRLEQRIANLPGVTSTAIATNAVPPISGWNMGVEVLGSSTHTRQPIRLNLIDPAYFSVLHIPLREGRLWDQAENMNSAPVVAVNQAMAHRYWPNGDALGQQIRFPAEMRSPPPSWPAVADVAGWMQVIGVVGDALNDGLRHPVQPAVYMPFTRLMQPFTQILVRTNVPPLSELQAVRAAVQSENSEQQVGRESRDLEQFLTSLPEWKQTSLISALFAAFSFMALVLAVIGLYSVVSFSVAQRTNEFGVRMALGAQPNNVVWLAVASTGVAVGSGFVAGGLLVFGLGKVATRWIPATAHSFPALAAATAVLLTLSFLASYLPARRAAKIDPMVALRYQ